MKQLVLVIISAFVLTACLGDKDQKTNENKTAMNKKAGTFTGFDLNGDQKTCAAMPGDRMCTMQMTDSDFFAQKCREMGHHAFQCDCHDWLCSEKLPSGDAAEK